MAIAVVGHTALDDSAVEIQTVLKDNMVAEEQAALADQGKLPGFEAVLEDSEAGMSLARL